MNAPKDLSTLVSALIGGFVAESGPDPLNLRKLASEANVLPLYVDMGGVLAIDAGGNILLFPLDDRDHPGMESDPRIRNMAIFQGSKKHPELKELIPVKPSDAHTCPYCQGTGVEAYSSGLSLNNVVCYCGGLGWLP